MLGTQSNSQSAGATTSPTGAKGSDSPRKKRNKHTNNDKTSSASAPRTRPNVSLSSGEGDPLIQVFHFLYKLQEKGAPMSLLLPQTILYEHHFPRFWFTVDTQTQSQRQRKLDEERKREQAEMLEIIAATSPLAAKKLKQQQQLLQQQQQGNTNNYNSSTTDPSVSDGLAPAGDIGPIGPTGTGTGTGTGSTQSNARRVSKLGGGGGGVDEPDATTAVTFQSQEIDADTLGLTDGSINAASQPGNASPKAAAANNAPSALSVTLQQLTAALNRPLPSTKDTSCTGAQSGSPTSGAGGRSGNRALPPAARHPKLPPASMEALRQASGYNSNGGPNASMGVSGLNSSPQRAEPLGDRGAGGPTATKTGATAANTNTNATKQQPANTIKGGESISTLAKQKEQEIKWASAMTIVRKGGKECDATSIRNTFLVDPSTVPIPLTLKQAAAEMFSSASSGPAFLSTGSNGTIINYANRPEYVGCLAAMRDPTTNEIIVKGMGPKELEAFMLRTPDTTVLSRYVHLGSNNTAAVGGKSGGGAGAGANSEAFVGPGSKHKGSRRRPVDGSKVAELTAGGIGGGRRRHEIITVSWTPGCLSTEMRTCNADLNDFRVPVADRVDTNNLSHFKESVAYSAMVSQIRDSILRFVAATEQYENKKVLLFRGYFRLDEHNRPWFLFADDFIVRPMKAIQRDLIGEAMVAKLQAEANDRAILQRYARYFGIVLSGSAGSIAGNQLLGASAFGATMTFNNTLPSSLTGDPHHNHHHQQQAAAASAKSFNSAAGNSYGSQHSNSSQQMWSEDLSPHEKEALFTAAKDLLQKIRKEHVRHVARVTAMRNSPSPTKAKALGNGHGSPKAGTKGGGSIQLPGIKNSESIRRASPNEAFDNDDDASPLGNPRENSKAALYKSAILMGRRSTNLSSLPSLLSPSQLVTAATGVIGSIGGGGGNITQVVSRPSSQPGSQHPPAVSADPHIMSVISPPTMINSPSTVLLTSTTRRAQSPATVANATAPQSSVTPASVINPNPHLAVFGITEEDLFLLLMAADNGSDPSSIIAPSNTGTGAGGMHPTNNNNTSLMGNSVSIGGRSSAGAVGGGTPPSSRGNSPRMHRHVITKILDPQQGTPQTSPATTPTKQQNQASATTPSSSSKHKKSHFASTVPVDDDGQPLWTVEDQRRYKLSVLRRTLPKHFLDNPDVTDELLMEVEDQLDHIITNADAKRKQREYQKRQAVALRAQTLSFAANASRTRKALNTHIPALTRTIEDLRCHVVFTECPVDDGEQAADEVTFRSAFSEEQVHQSGKGSKQRGGVAAKPATLEEALVSDKHIIVFGDRRLGTVGSKEALNTAKRQHRKSTAAGLIANSEDTLEQINNWWWNGQQQNNLSNTTNLSPGISRRNSKPPVAAAVTTGTTPQRSSSISSAPRNSVSADGLGALYRTTSGTSKRQNSMSPNRRGLMLTATAAATSSASSLPTTVTPLNDLAIKQFVFVRAVPTAPPPSPRLPYCAEDRYGQFGEVLPPVVVPNLAEDAAEGEDRVEDGAGDFRLTLEGAPMAKVGEGNKNQTLKSEKRRANLDEFEEFRFKVLLLVRLGLIPEKFSTLAKLDGILEVPAEDDKKTYQQQQVYLSTSDLSTVPESKSDIIAHNHAIMAELLRDDILLRSRLADEELFPPEIELKPLSAPPPAPPQASSPTAASANNASNAMTSKGTNSTTASLLAAVNEPNSPRKDNSLPNTATAPLTPSKSVAFSINTAAATSSSPNGPGSPKSPRGSPPKPSSPTTIMKSRAIVTQVVHATSKEMKAEAEKEKQTKKEKAAARSKESKRESGSQKSPAEKRSPSSLLPKRNRSSTKDATPTAVAFNAKSLMNMKRSGSGGMGIIGSGTSLLNNFYENEMSKTRSIFRAKNAAAVAREQHYYHRQNTNKDGLQVATPTTSTAPPSLSPSAAAKRARFNFGYEDPINPYNSEIFGPRASVQGIDDVDIGSSHSQSQMTSMRVPPDTPPESLSKQSRSPSASSPSERPFNNNATSATAANLKPFSNAQQQNRSYASMKMSKALGMTGTMRMFLRMERRAGSDSDSDVDAVSQGSGVRKDGEGSQFGSDEEQVQTFYKKNEPEKVSKKPPMPGSGLSESLKSSQSPPPQLPTTTGGREEMHELSFRPKRVNSGSMSMQPPQVTARPGPQAASTDTEKEPVVSSDSVGHANLVADPIIPLVGFAPIPTHSASPPTVSGGHASLSDQKLLDKSTMQKLIEDSGAHQISAGHTTHSPRLPLETARGGELVASEPSTVVGVHRPSSASAVTPTVSGGTVANIPSNTISPTQSNSNNAMPAPTITSGPAEGPMGAGLLSAPQTFTKRASTTTTAPHPGQTKTQPSKPLSTAKKGILDFCAAFVQRGIPFSGVAAKDSGAVRRTVSGGDQNFFGTKGVVVFDSNNITVNLADSSRNASPSRAAGGRKASRLSDALANSTTTFSEFANRSPQQKAGDNQTLNVADPHYGLRDELGGSMRTAGDAGTNTDGGPFHSRPFLLPSASNKRGSILHSPASKYRRRGSSILLAEQGGGDAVGSLSTSLTNHPQSTINDNLLGFARVGGETRASFSYFNASTNASAAGGGGSENYDSDFTNSKRRRRQSARQGSQGGTASWGAADSIRSKGAAEAEELKEFPSAIISSRYYQAIISTLEVDDRVEFDSLCARHEQLISIVEDLSYTIYSSMLCNDGGDRQRVFVEADLLPHVHKMFGSSVRIVEDVDVDGNAILTSGAAALGGVGESAGERRSNSPIARRARGLTTTASPTSKVGSTANETSEAFPSQSSLLPPIGKASSTSKPVQGGVTSSGERLPMPYATVANEAVDPLFKIGRSATTVILPPLPNPAVPPTPSATPQKADNDPSGFLLSQLTSPLIVPNYSAALSLGSPTAPSRPPVEVPMFSRAGSIAELSVYTVLFPYPAYALTREDLLFCGFFPLFSEDDDTADVDERTHTLSAHTLALSEASPTHHHESSGGRRESNHTNGSGNLLPGAPTMSASFSPMRRFDQTPNANKGLQFSWFDGNTLKSPIAQALPSAPVGAHEGFSGGLVSPPAGPHLADKLHTSNPLQLGAADDSSAPSLAVYGLHNASFFSDYTVVMAARRSAMRTVFFGAGRRESLPYGLGSPDDVAPLQSAAACEAAIRKGRAASSYRTCRFAVAAAGGEGQAANSSARTADQFRKLMQVLRRKMDDVEREFLVSGGVAAEPIAPPPASTAAGNNAATAPGQQLTRPPSSAAKQQQKDPPPRSHRVPEIVLLDASKLCDPPAASGAPAAEEGAVVTARGIASTEVVAQAMQTAVDGSPSD